MYDFIPEVWSLRILNALERNLVFRGITNGNYQGDASFGNKVWIRSVGDVDEGEYIPGVTQIDPSDLDTSAQLLEIDRRRYFSFKIDDVHKAQTDVELQEDGIRKGLHKLMSRVDTDISGLWSQAGSISSAVTVTAATAYADLLSLSEALSTKDVPEEGRWVVVPEWFANKLAIAQLLVTDSGAAAGAWTRGFMGRCAGFDVIKSNNVAIDNNRYKIMAGTRDAIAFVIQVQSVERYRIEKGFADGYKGLVVYGRKVIAPDQLAVLDAVPGSES